MASPGVLSSIRHYKVWCAINEITNSYVHLYINLRRARDSHHSWQPMCVWSSFVAAGAAVRRINSLRFGQLLRWLSTNALYNERIHGKEEHASWINTIPLKISHLFGFSVSNRLRRCDSLACLRLDSCYSISLFDSNHFIGDTPPLFG